MVEQTNQAELSFVKAEHLNGGKTGQAHVEDYSYDKDVVEIKLPDTVLSPDHGAHFVKDVCIDEGVSPDQRAPTDRLVDQEVSIHLDSSECINGDLREEISADSTKTALELKPQMVILPVMCETDGNTGEQNSCKNHDLEDSNTADVSPGSNDDELNPKQLPCHEVALDCQEVGSAIPESNENQDRLFTAEATHQVSSNGCYGTGIGIVLETSNVIHSDLRAQPAAAAAAAVDFSAAATPEEVAASAASDMEGYKQANHYNPFIAYGSLDGTWEPEPGYYYSLPATVVDGAASTAPTCPVEKTDSFSDLVNGALEGLFHPVGMGGEGEATIIEENRLDRAEESSRALDNVQASEQCNGQRVSHVPYSGNVSLRSESSTTSARSFAFPALQNEWNSSPVKMAKADRRRVKEDRGWGYRILCCKF